jgi:hypothetical protein
MNLLKLQHFTPKRKKHINYPNGIETIKQFCFQYGLMKINTKKWEEKHLSQSSC